MRRWFHTNGASRHPESGPRGSSLPRWENRGKYPREPFINSARSFPTILPSLKCDVNTVLLGAFYDAVMMKFHNFIVSVVLCMCYLLGKFYC